jgi:hypothetical protein
MYSTAGCIWKILLNPTPSIMKMIIIMKSELLFQNTYNTWVEYRCVNGSQFDTNKDGKGDTILLQTRCLWNKTWSPWPVLPPCYITHCVNPFPIPNDTSLMVSVRDASVLTT